MSQELAKNLYCVQMRSGVELWVEKDLVGGLQNELERLTNHRFLFFEDQTINTADIVGVFTAKTMAELVKRKNGYWFCDYQKWHKKNEDCECRFYKYDEKGKLIEKFIPGTGWVKQDNLQK